MSHNLWYNYRGQVNDIGFSGKPYDQTSDVSVNTSAELNRLTNPIRGYYTSVGNQARRHYQELYVDSGVDGAAFVGQSGSFHRFGPTQDTTDCYGLGPAIGNPILVNPSNTVVVFLTWDDTWGAASTDYDLYLFDNATGQMVLGSTDDNVNVTGDPVEVVAVTNGFGSAKFIDVYIHNFQNAATPKALELFVLGGTACPIGTDPNFNTIASSVPAQSDAGGGVISAGAIDASDPGTDDIEPFSSHGPTNNGVVKPDVTAIDGVAVTGAGGFPSTFFGTSAAAPHVAGLAALLLSLRPDLKAGEAGDDPAADRAALRSAIVGTAVDLGAAGVDNTFGSGRVHGLKAAAPLLVAPTVTAGPNGAASEGASFSASVATFTDLNPTDAHTATVSWGDSTALGTATINDSAGTVAASHAYADNGVYTATVTVTDDDGKSTSGTFTVTVANVPPVVTALPNLRAYEASPSAVTVASFTDAGVLDTHTATINWGDGSGASAATVAESSGSGTVRATHTYAATGLYNGTVTVTDNAGGVHATAIAIEVVEPPPVPAVSSWALALMAAAFAGSIAWGLRRRARSTAA